MHLKMMRLLFLSLLLLLPAATVLSFDDGSGDDDFDDEDLTPKKYSPVMGSSMDKGKSEDKSPDQVTLIVIVAVVSTLALSIAAVVAIMLMKRRLNTPQPAIYTVPTEQNQKEAI